MAILDDTRSDWNARPPLRALTKVPWSERIGVSWHWIGDGRGPSASGSHTRCLEQVRDWQAQHQDPNGRIRGKDIGYNALICQHARAIEGRGLDVSGAHSPGVNWAHVGIQFMVGSGTPGGVSAAMIARAQRLRADVGRLGKNIRRDWGHRDDPKVSTSCPGDAIERWVKSGGPTSGTVTTTAPVALRRGDSGPYVVELQKALNAAGASLTVDGSFGPATEAAVRKFQEDNGLEVDGIAGPATQAALKAATTPAPAPIPTLEQEAPTMFLVKRKDQDPVYKTDGFRRVHITREERDALLSVGVKLNDQFTTDAQLAAFGPVDAPAPEVTP